MNNGFQLSKRLKDCNNPVSNVLCALALTWIMAPCRIWAIKLANDPIRAHNWLIFYYVHALMAWKVGLLVALGPAYRSCRSVCECPTVVQSSPPFTYCLKWQVHITVITKPIFLIAGHTACYTDKGYKEGINAHLLVTTNALYIVQRYIFFQYFISYTVKVWKYFMKVYKELQISTIKCHRQQIYLIICISKKLHGVVQRQLANSLWRVCIIRVNERWIVCKVLMPAWIYAAGKLAAQIIACGQKKWLPEFNHLCTMRCACAGWMNNGGMNCSMVCM